MSQATFFLICRPHPIFLHQYLTNLLDNVSHLCLTGPLAALIIQSLLELQVRRWRNPRVGSPSSPLPEPPSNVSQPHRAHCNGDRACHAFTAISTSKYALANAETLQLLCQWALLLTRHTSLPPIPCSATAQLSSHTACSYRISSLSSYSISFSGGF